jgi:uncharacterized repeat protein (TIGR03847 family)
LTVGVRGKGEEQQFVLQGSAGPNLVTLRIDREQAAALSEAIGELLALLAERYPRDLNELAIPIHDRMRLLEPVQPSFSIAHFQLAYKAEQDRAVVIAVELQRIRLTPARAARIVRFWVTREQLVALARRVEYVLGAPSTACPFCGQPIDPEGHHCARLN